MKDPVRILLEEHTLLLKAIETGRDIQEVSDDTTYSNLMNDFIIFIRNYTEIYHHPKEESILYPLLQNRSSAMSAEFIFEICDNHEDFKSMIASIENHFVACDYKQLRKDMFNYFKLLTDHIQRENIIILSVASDILTIEEKENIYNLFETIDKTNGEKEELTKTLYKIIMKTIK